PIPSAVFKKSAPVVAVQSQASKAQILVSPTISPISPATPAPRPIMTPSPEDQAKIESLQGELKAVKAEVASAEQKNAGLAGGLVKALVEVRLEVIKTTEALIQQRIQALASGAKVSVTVSGTQADEKLAQSLEVGIKKQEGELKAAQTDAAQYSGGLVGAMK